MNKRLELANLIFGDITQTIADLEKLYPPRNLPHGAYVTRFAPSPTGFLHTGSLFTALISQKMAKQTSGVFFIRLEDTDTKREIEGAGAMLVSELAKFNVIGEGYVDDNTQRGDYGPYQQSQRADIYKVVIKEMIIRDLAYPCFCTFEELSQLRMQLESEKLRPGYYRQYAKCRHLSVEEQIEKIKAGVPYIIRFKSSGNFDHKIKVKDLVRGELELSQNDQDIVIFKSDGLPTYHFAHLVDDHFMRTNLVSRGEEWLPSLTIHIELFESLNFEVPQYAHLPVIMKLDNGNKRKLSKRKDEEAAVTYFFEQGYPLFGFVEYLFTIANSNFEQWRSENPNAPLDDFPLSFDKMSLDGALFDLAKVKNICKDRLSRLNKDQITDLLLTWSKEYDGELFNLINRDVEYFKQIINIEREKENPRKDYEKYSDVKNAVLYFYDDYFDQVTLEFNPLMKQEDIKNVLRQYQKDLHLNLSEEEWFEQIKILASNSGFAPNVKDYKKNKEAYKGHVGDVSEIIRVAVTGRRQSQNLYYVLKILGCTRVNQRIKRVLEKL